MLNPFSPFLVFGIVINSSGTAEPSATVKITTSLGTMSCDTDSLGRYIKDIADIGYTDGETVTLDNQDQFNNEFSEDTFVLSGGMKEVNISLSVRSKAQGNPTGYTTKTMLHNIGNKPITKDNPLPIEIIGQSDVIDLVNNPQHEWIITRQDRQPDSETVTMGNGDIYKRTFTYTNDVMTLRSKWIKQ